MPLQEGNRDRRLYRAEGGGRNRVHLGPHRPVAGRIAARPAQHGEAFNFGPVAEQNRTVVELLDDLARFWGLAAGQRAYDIVAGEKFHEAGLLKLNCYMPVC